MLQNIFNFSIQKNLPAILLIILSGTTVATSSAAGIKLYQSIQDEDSHPEPIELATSISSQTTPNPSSGSPETVVNDLSNPSNLAPQPTSTPTSLPTSTNTSSLPAATGSSPSFPTAIPTPAPSPAPGSSTATPGGCIITVAGTQYDISQAGDLRTTHPGPKGNFFTCGTDMTTTFNTQHGTKYSMLSKYAIGTSGNGSVAGSTTGYYDDSEDEDEDEHEQERYLDEEDEEDEEDEVDDPDQDDSEGNHEDDH